MFGVDSCGSLSDWFFLFTATTDLALIGSMLLFASFISFATTTNTENKESQLFFTVILQHCRVAFGAPKPNEQNNSLAHSLSFFFLLCLILFNHVVNLAVVCTDNSDEHVEKQQIEEYHKGHKEQRHESHISSFFQVIIVEVACDDHEERMDGFEN